MDGGIRQRPGQHARVSGRSRCCDCRIGEAAAYATAAQARSHGQERQLGGAIVIRQRKAIESTRVRGGALTVPRSPSGDTDDATRDLGHELVRRGGERMSQVRRHRLEEVAECGRIPRRCRPDGGVAGRHLVRRPGRGRLRLGRQLGSQLTEERRPVASSTAKVAMLSWPRFDRNTKRPEGAIAIPAAVLSPVNDAGVAGNSCSGVRTPFSGS